MTYFTHLRFCYYVHVVPNEWDSKDCEASPQRPLVKRALNVAFINLELVVRVEKESKRAMS
jgi:hypothetical protein